MLFVNRYDVRMILPQRGDGTRPVASILAVFFSPREVQPFSKPGRNECPVRLDFYVSKLDVHIMQRLRLAEVAHEHTIKSCWRLDDPARAVPCGSEGLWNVANPWGF